MQKHYKMVMPKVDLPAELRKAERLSHPRWGQMFLATYSQFKILLEAEDWQSIEGSEKLILTIWKTQLLMLSSGSG